VTGGTTPGRPKDRVRVGLSVAARNATGKALQVYGLTADELRAIDRDDALAFLQRGRRSVLPAGGLAVRRRACRVVGGDGSG
jgi:hypothetical protein